MIDELECTEEGKLVLEGLLDAIRIEKDAEGTGEDGVDTGGVQRLGSREGEPKLGSTPSWLVAALSDDRKILPNLQNVRGGSGELSRLASALEVISAFCRQL